MVETVSEHCIHKDCKYRSRSTLMESCDYMLVTRRPRGCKISECDKYEAGKKKMISTLVVIAHDADERADRMYRKWKESKDERVDSKRGES